MASKKYSRKEVVRILKVASRKEETLEALLQHLYTPREYDEFAVRVEILKRLLHEDPQRTIAKDLGVGVATVTRGSRELRRMTPSIKKIILEE